MRIASTCAGVAFSPRRTRTGSVGMTLEIRKTMTTSPAKVGTNQASRETIISRRRIPEASHMERGPPKVGDYPDRVRLIAGSAPLRGAHELCDPQRRATEWRAPSKDHERPGGPRSNAP